MSENPHTAPRDEVLAQLAECDLWLDGGVAPRYLDQPLAQDLARVLKIGEELGEAIEALIALTGQNPRKPIRAQAKDELLGELADTAITAILAIQHFTKDADETAAVVLGKFAYVYDRMRAHPSFASVMAGGAAG